MLETTIDCPECGDAVYLMVVRVKPSRAMGQGKTIERRRCPVCDARLAFHVTIERGISS